MTPSTVDPLRATVYGPSVAATVQVNDPRALGALVALHAPSVPRPVIAAPRAPPAPRARLATAGLALAIAVPPSGLVVSAAALTRILERTPRPPGELRAALGIAVAVISMAAALALASG